MKRAAEKQNRLWLGHWALIKGMQNSLGVKNVLPCYQDTKINLNLVENRLKMKFLMLFCYVAQWVKKNNKTQKYTLVCFFFNSFYILPGEIQ